MTASSSTQNLVHKPPPDVEGEIIDDYEDPRTNCCQTKEKLEVGD